MPAKNKTSNENEKLKKDPESFLKEAIEEKLAVTRQCLANIEKKLKRKELRNKMGTAIISHVVNPDQPNIVSYSYPDPAMIEKLSFIANNLVYSGKCIFHVEKFVESVSEKLDCIELTYIDMKEDDSPTESRAPNGPMIRRCENPWPQNQPLTIKDYSQTFKEDFEEFETTYYSDVSIKEKSLLEKKKKYMEVLLSSERIGFMLSGIFVNDSNIFQMKTDDGKLFVDLIQAKGLIIGTEIEMENSTSPEGENILLGLDDLGQRILEKKNLGHQFIIARCNFEVSEKYLSPSTLFENCRVLGRFSCICQANMVVPIIDLNIQANQDESLNLVQERSESILISLCKNLLDNNVCLEGMLLKIRMIKPGQTNASSPTLKEIAMTTVTVLKRSIPVALPGIIFSPGVFEEEDFLLVLNEANRIKGKAPWTFGCIYGSFSQEDVVNVWEGNEANIKEAQILFLSKIDRYNIFALNYLNESVDPCDDFYDYVCGNFKKYNPLPPGEGVWDSFSILQHEIHEMVQNILETPASQNDSESLQKSKTAYIACIDLDSIDQKTLIELEIINELGGWPLIMEIDDGNITFNLLDSAEIMSEYGIEIFFNFQVVPNLLNASENVLYITEDEVSRSGIRERHGKKNNWSNHDFSPDIFAHYSFSTSTPFETFLKNVALRIKNATNSQKNNDDIDKEIQDLINFIAVLEEGGYTNNSYGSSVVIETIASLQTWTDLNFGKNLTLDWLTFINKIIERSGAEVTNSTKIMLSSRSSLYGILHLLVNTSPRVLKNFIIARLLLFMAPDADYEMRYYFEQLYTQENITLYDRSEYCVRKILDYPDGIGFSYALTIEYFQKYFNQDKLTRVTSVIEELFESFINLLENADWLDDSTKEKAIEKAEEMYLLIGFPDEINNQTVLDNYYENLGIFSLDHFGNSQRIRAFTFASKFSQISQPRNRKIWTMSPLEINSYYSPQNNRIQLPLGILNAALFYSSIFPPFDYGRLGMIIGHEITHGFDNQGRYYDKLGTFSNWWSKNVSSDFETKQSCFLDQYSQYYIPEISKNVSSTRTVRENIADNGGLRSAYYAFKTLNLATDGFTPDQLFFIGFGTMWCSEETTDYLNYISENSAYAPSKFRVNGPLSNMPEFGEAFNCTNGSKMNPEKKCILW